ncbi:Uncharacterised protein [Vibrio cholerae]|nr:Uncharacterised protein [Vibrio cholerae]CSD36700.1 Uncharacterised protein [Vibrio cholerae]
MPAILMSAPSIMPGIAEKRRFQLAVSFELSVPAK